MRFEYVPSATPIDPDEAKGLIPSHLTLQRELNEYEESNILEATEWLLARRTDKNIGVSWFEIPVRLRQMLGDVRAQIEHQAYSSVEIAARYHHRLVAIHVFPNGNGRHGRLMADLLLTELADQRFEWGRGSLLAANELRARYIAALQAADAGDCQPLLDFLDNG